VTVTVPFTGPRDEYREPADPDAEFDALPAATDDDGTLPGEAGHQGASGFAGLRLLPPRHVHAEAPSLTPDQQAAVDVARGSGPVLVPGAPGTGKTTVLIEAAVTRVFRDGVDPERMLILAPSRLAADALRDRFTARLDRSLSTTPARTWASYAFDVIRRAKAEGVLPLARPPRLLSGPEQDLIIKELLDGHSLPGLELPWPEDLAGALETRGFRHEVRQLFDRVIESGMTAGDLADLGRQCRRPVRGVP
jgi:superfamily I DNA/RNA helicase